MPKQTKNKSDIDQRTALSPEYLGQFDAEHERFHVMPRLDEMPRTVEREAKSLERRGLILNEASYRIGYPLPKKRFSSHAAVWG